MARFKYQKLQIPTQVTFAAKPGVLSTLEGNVNYKAGDALMTGIQGERWPIARDQFNLTYEPISPVNMGEDGTYVKKNMIVKAEQALAPFEIYYPDKQSTLKGYVGDWKVSSPEGNEWIVADSVFKQTYKLIKSD